MSMRALIWFTQDLRIKDNRLMSLAAQKGFAGAGVVFVDPNQSERQKWLRFSAAQSLQSAFAERGLEFFIVSGRAEKQLACWVAENQIDKVLVQASFNARENEVIASVKREVGADTVISLYQQSLLDPDQLPFAVSDLPTVFSNFRRKVESNFAVGEPERSEEIKYRGFSLSVPQGSVILDQSYKSKEMGLPFGLEPGEYGAWLRLRDYFWKTKGIARYKETRNGLMNLDDSSKLSIGLSLGCISARSIHKELVSFENQFGRNESTEWFCQELLWRDYFKFLALKEGDKIFHASGVQNKELHFEGSEQDFARWCRGETGVPFVDANMRELNQTGWMSNRGRQNVASYLAKTLKVDWTWGAQYFEDHLVDLDPESNWGNWQYLAGVGTDPRDRVFNVARQSEVYDPDGAYQKKWL